MNEMEALTLSKKLPKNGVINTLLTTINTFNIAVNLIYLRCILIYFLKIYQQAEKKSWSLVFICFISLRNIFNQ